MRWVALLIPLLSVGCERIIPLGSECPDFDGPCPNIGSGDDEPKADAAVSHQDAAAQGSPEAGALGGGEELDASAIADAGGPPDAAPDAVIAGDGGVALFPGIASPSFELQAGTATPLALGALGAQSMPWYGCRSGMSIVSEINTPGGDVVHPTEGATFFADGLSA